MPRKDVANPGGTGDHVRDFRDRVVGTIWKILQVFLALFWFIFPIVFLKTISWLDRQTDYYQRWAFSRVFLYALGTVLWLGVALILSFDDDLFIRPPGRTVGRESFMARAVSALIAASPVLWIFIWIQLGIPPSRSFFYYCIYLALLIFVIRLNKKRRASFLTRQHVFALGALAAMLLTSAVSIIFPILWADIAMRVADDSFLVPTPVTPSPCDRDNAVIAHISDLHITENQRTRDGKLRGNERLPLLLSRIDGSKAAYLVVSGDLTDSGSSGAWKITSSILTKGLPRTRVIATPGNHDLNEFFGLIQPSCSCEKRTTRLQRTSKRCHVCHALLFINPFCSRHSRRITTFHSRSLSQKFQRNPPLPRRRNKSASSNARTYGDRDCAKHNNALLPVARIGSSRASITSTHSRIRSL